MEKTKLREEIRTVQEWESWGKANGPRKQRAVGVLGRSIPSTYLPALRSRPGEDESRLQRGVQIRELRFDLSNGSGAVCRLVGPGALSAEEGWRSKPLGGSGAGEGSAQHPGGTH